MKGPILFVLFMVPVAGVWLLGYGFRYHAPACVKAGICTIVLGAVGLKVIPHRIKTI